MAKNNTDQVGSIAEILKQRQEINQGFRPLFFRLGDPADKEELYKLLKEKPHIKVADTLEQQLKELIKSAYPNRSIPEEQLGPLLDKHLKGCPLEAYGVWVYYPWNEKLVHILDEEEFVELRTNRNRYKITPEEQRVLAGKKVGVIGLSVGQSVSLALAMERGFGELRIADFDELEITNLNRLRSGVHNLGLKKTVIVAREIAEIDPYLKVTCFHEGINTDNLESFLVADGKLDVLIDECDGVDIKLHCRILAKAHQIPVLMEASDRGTVDVERFDLEPDRPILHGFIQHLDVSNIKHLKTNEQKLPYILAFAGVETLSVRMKASAVEVGQTISTWPQLASAVIMGGGITADVCRRVLLGQFHRSGRFFIDLEELIGDPKKPLQKFAYLKKSLSETEMAQEAKRVVTDRDGKWIPDPTQIEELVKAAVAAPSPGNNQPWKWYFDGSTLFLFHDIERSESFGDFDNMASYMALGTAIENVTIKAKSLGIELLEQLFPLKDQPLLVASFSFKKSTPQHEDLVNHIGKRCTNRRFGDGLGIDAWILSELQKSVEAVDGATIRLITEENDIASLASLAGKADRLRLLIPQGHHELFKRELRWPSGENVIKEGLDIRTLELASKDEIGFRVASDPEAIQLIADWDLGGALATLSTKPVLTSSAVGVITMPSFSPENCLLAGKAVERMWLTASKNRISLHPLLALILHVTRIRYGQGGDMPKKIEDAFRLLEQEFNSVFDIDPKKEVPLFFFRLFNGERPSERSLRLDLEDIFFQPNSRSE